MVSNIQTSFRPRLAFELPEHDVREPRKLPPIRLKGGISRHASGSATCEVGNTKAICVIYGPKAKKAQGRAEFDEQGSISIQANYAPFSTREASIQNIDGRLDRELSHFLDTSIRGCIQLDRFPKSELDISLTILENDGCSLSYALVLSGVELFDVVSSVTICVSADNVLVFGPTLKQERDALVTCTLGFHGGTGGEMVSTHLVASPSMDPHLLHELISQGKDVCVSVIDPIMRRFLEREQEEFIL